MSTEATLDAPATAVETYVNDTSASGIMSRFKAAEPAPAPASPAPSPAADPAPANPTPPADPAPAPEPAPVDDSGVETPLTDLGADPKTDEPKSDLPIDEDPPGPVKTPEAKYKWGELRKKADEYDALTQKTLPQKEKELAELKAKVEELANIPEQYKKQLEEKEATLAEYERKVAVFDIQSSRQYQEQVLVPITRVGEELNNLARHYETDLSQIEAAMTILDPVAQEKKLMELAEGWHPRHQNKLFDLAEKTVQLYSVAEQLEANALEARKELESARELETRKQQEESLRAIQTSAEAVKKQMLAKVPVLKDEALQQKVFAAELDPKDPVRKAYNAYAGEALPAVLKELAARDMRIRELEQAAQARATAQPRPGAGNAATAAAAASNPNPPLPEGETTWHRMQAWKASQA